MPFHHPVKNSKGPGNCWCIIHSPRRFGQGGAMSKRIRPFLLVLCLFLLAPSLGALRVRAASSAIFTVNSTADVLDRKPGDGKCETGRNNKVCTLRAAIMETNALAGGDTIVLPKGTYYLMIPGGNEDKARTGDLDIKGNLVINGTGVTTTIIDGNTTITGDRVIDIIGSVTVKIGGVTIQGGQVQNATGGGIQNEKGTLTLTKSTVFGNHALLGGGIYNLTGTVKVVNSTIDHNSSPSENGGGIYNYYGTVTISNSRITNNFAKGLGGGIYDGRKLTITRSLIANNEAALGGGLSSSGSTKIVKSTFTGNHTDDHGLGGGIYRGDGTQLIQDSTLSGNTAGLGGAIYNGSSTINLINSTISGNSADQGGGIWNSRGAFYQGIVKLFNVTVAYNNASSLAGGVYNDPGGSLSSANSLIANNSRDCWGALTSQDYNLIQDTTDCAIVGPSSHNIYGQDPNLGGLSNYGGPTETHSLISPS